MYFPVGEGRGPFAYWDRVTWLQWDVLYEVQTESGFTFTVGVGQAWQLGYSGRHCIGSDTSNCDSAMPMFSLSGSLSIGYAF
jgi:hypothetical protein